MRVKARSPVGRLYLEIPRDIQHPPANYRGDCRLQYERMYRVCCCPSQCSCLHAISSLDIYLSRWVLEKKFLCDFSRSFSYSVPLRPTLPELATFRPVNNRLTRHATRLQRSACAVPKQKTVSPMVSASMILDSIRELTLALRVGLVQTEHGRQAYVHNIA